MRLGAARMPESFILFSLSEVPKPPHRVGTKPILNIRQEKAYLESGYDGIVAIGVLDYGHEVLGYVLDNPESVGITIGGSRAIDEFVDHADA